MRPTIPADNGAKVAPPESYELASNKQNTVWLDKTW